MSFASWLTDLFGKGVSFLPAPVTLQDRDIPEVAGILSAEFQIHALEVGGPRLDFTPAAALDSAQFLARACWQLFASRESPELDPLVATEPRTPSVHLSADLCLRFLPVLLRRARLQSADGPLTRCLKEVLRQWPLSGVLGDLEEGPAVPLDFQEHSGLQILYAERLLRFPRTAWLPESGSARESVELVFHQQQKLLPLPHRREENANA